MTIEQQLAELRAEINKLKETAPSNLYRVRRDKLKNWEESNQTPYDGQLCAITDRQIILCGDGQSTFDELYSTYLDTKEIKNNGEYAPESDCTDEKSGEKYRWVEQDIFTGEMKPMADYSNKKSRK